MHMCRFALLLFFTSQVVGCLGVDIEATAHEPLGRESDHRPGYCRESFWTADNLEASPWGGATYDWGGNTTEGIDCSHLVHALYRWAGIDVGSYCERRNGTNVCQTASGWPSHCMNYYQAVDPADVQPGDAIVWSGGHVGIVTDPVEGTYYGSQSSTGPAESNYLTNSYWCDGCARGSITFYRPSALANAVERGECHDCNRFHRRCSLDWQQCVYDHYLQYVYDGTMDADEVPESLLEPWSGSGYFEDNTCADQCDGLDECSEEYIDCVLSFSWTPYSGSAVPDQRARERARQEMEDRCDFRRDACEGTDDCEDASGNRPGSGSGGGEGRGDEGSDGDGEGTGRDPSRTPDDSGSTTPPESGPEGASGGSFPVYCGDEYVGEAETLEEATAMCNDREGDNDGGEEGAPPIA